MNVTFNQRFKIVEKIVNSNNQYLVEDLENNYKRLFKF